jgi:hypothetical protein
MCSSEGKTTFGFEDCSTAKAMYTSGCDCSETSTTSVCDNPGSYEYCIVGTGPGALGAFSALDDSGKSKKTLVVERGYDASYFNNLLEASNNASLLGMGCFPNANIKSSQDSPKPVFDAWGDVFPWKKINTPGCITQVSGTLQQWSCSNTIGGGFAYNGGGWFDDIDILTASNYGRLEASMKSVNAKLGISSGNMLCTGVCERIFKGAKDTSEVTFHKVPTTVNMSHLSLTGCPQRLSIENIIKAANTNFKSRTTVDYLRQNGNSYDLVRSDSSTIATCEHVILSTGAYQTPAILQKSQHKASLNIPSGVGQGLSNHFGQYVISLCGGDNHSAPAMGIPVAIDVKDGMSQTLIYPAGPAENKVQSIYVIPYGGLNSDRNSDVIWNSTSGEVEVHGGQFVLSEALRDSLNRTTTATLEALQAAYNNSCAFTYAIPPEVVTQPPFNINPTPSPDIPSVVANFLKIVTYAGFGIYHPFSSMLNATHENGTVKNLANIVVADASSIKSVLGSPSAMIAAKAYDDVFNYVSKHSSVSFPNPYAKVEPTSH